MTERIVRVKVPGHKQTVAMQINRAYPLGNHLTGTDVTVAYDCGVCGEAVKQKVIFYDDSLSGLIMAMCKSCADAIAVHHLIEQETPI